MTDSPDLISFSAYVGFVSTDIQLKWMALWTDLHNPLHGAGYFLDPDIHAYDHTTRPEALTDLYTMFDKINSKAAVRLAIFFQGKERCNVLRIQHMDKCSKDESGGMVLNVCQALS